MTAGEESDNTFEINQKTKKVDIFTEYKQLSTKKMKFVFCRPSKEIPKNCFNNLVDW